MEPEIKVTKIGKWWHARITDGKYVSEMKCEERIDIGYICRDLCRWYDKLGGMSKFASAARHRQHRGPYGVVKMVRN